MLQNLFGFLLKIFFSGQMTRQVFRHLIVDCCRCRQYRSNDLILPHSQKNDEVAQEALLLAAGTGDPQRPHHFQREERHDWEEEGVAARLPGSLSSSSAGHLTLMLRMMTRKVMKIRRKWWLSQQLPALIQPRGWWEVTRSTRWPSSQLPEKPILRGPVCRKMKDVRKDTRFYCKASNVPLCKEYCFDRYHSVQKYYWTWQEAGKHGGGRGRKTWKILCNLLCFATFLFVHKIQNSMTFYCKVHFLMEDEHWFDGRHLNKLPSCKDDTRKDHLHVNEVEKAPAVEDIG